MTTYGEVKLVENTEVLELVNKNLEERDFFPESCIRTFENGFEVTSEIGFGHSFIIGYVSPESVAVTYIDVDNGDDAFLGVFDNQTAASVITKCLDDIVRDSE